MIMTRKQQVILAKQMMKVNFKIIGLVVLFLLVVSSLGPTILLAQNNKGQQNQVGQAICQWLKGLEPKLEARIQNRLQRIVDRRNFREDKLAERRQFREKQLTQMREHYNKVRDEHYAKLAELADTEIKKQAVADLQQAIEAAVQARKDAVDLAIDQFRNDLDQAIVDRKNAIDQSVDNYHNTVKMALQNAQNDCQNGEDMNQIRTTLRNSIKEAKNQYKTDLEGIEKIGDIVQSLIDNRKAAFQAAFDEFKIALKQAKEDFRDVFGEKSFNEDTENQSVEDSAGE